MNKILKSIFISFALVLLTATAVNAQSPAAPKFEIITPSEGQTIYGNKIPTLFNVENFQIVDFNQNQKPASGQGHIHLWLDDENPTAETAVKVIEDTFTYSDVPYGEHTLIAQLVQNNHQPISPPQKVTVKFTSAPIAAPDAVATSGFDKKTALVILVVVALVIVAAWWYTKEEDEEEEQEGEKPKKKTARRKSKSRK